MSALALLLPLARSWWGHFWGHTFMGNGWRRDEREPRPREKSRLEPQNMPGSSSLGCQCVLRPHLQTPCDPQCYMWWGATEAMAGMIGALSCCVVITVVKKRG